MILNTKIFQPLSVFLLLCVCCFMLQAEVVSTPREKRPALRNYLISRATLTILCGEHYNRTEVTPQMMSRWYDAYFDLLDGNRIYFLKSEVEGMRNMEGTLWNAESGYVNLEFALKVYELYLQRMEEWVKYSSQALNENHDYSVKEYMPVNQEIDEIQWCGTREELRERWRLRIKNILLADKLDQEERQQRLEAKGDGKDGGQ
jgi:hypothetical protein